MNPELQAHLHLTTILGSFAIAWELEAHAYDDVAVPSGRTEGREIRTSRITNRVHPAGTRPVMPMSRPGSGTGPRT
jgi:hypothetical protein